MTKATERAAQRKKTKRLNSLRKWRAKDTSRFEAIERRERGEAARLGAIRRRDGQPATFLSRATLERRRREYLDSPTVRVPESISPRAICAALLVAFALPIVVALGADIAVLLAGEHGATVAQAPSVHHVPESGLLHHKIAVFTSHPQPRHPAHALTKVKPHGSAVAAAPQRPFFRSIIANIQKIFSRNPEPQAAPQRVASQPQAGLPVRLAPRALHHPKRHAVVAHHRTHASPWSISPDGTWTALVRAPFSSPDTQFSASAGRLIALERSATDSDGAIVSMRSPGNVQVTITSPDRTAFIRLPAPDDEPAAFDVSAMAVGPHLVNVGWTPIAATANISGYKVYRSSGEGERDQLIAQLPASSHTLHDKEVDASSRYRYVVVADTSSDPLRVSTQTISTPAELPASSANALNGKGMFLYFSSLAGDPHSYRRYDPEAVITEARTAGIGFIELRMARGSCVMAQTPGARGWLDHLIDAAAAANIKLVAWTVPRRVTTEDLAQTVAAASYTTPQGNGFSGLALDLETGERYMGRGAEAKENLVQYIDAIRSAVGQHYLIVATVASPGTNHLTNDDYPFARIAAFADVLQPMEYWHYFYESTHHEYAHGEVASAAKKAVLRTRELAGRDIPVNVAGQSVDLEGTGAPSGREIAWSLKSAKSVGAIGEAFFDWAGTRPDAWAAIQAFDW